MVSCDSIQFRHCPAQVPWPRRGQPWTPAEDTRLLELWKAAATQAPDVPPYSFSKKAPVWAVAKALGRTPCGVMARYQGLALCKKRAEGGCL